MIGPISAPGKLISRFHLIRREALTRLARSGSRLGKEKFPVHVLRQEAKANPIHPTLTPLLLHRLVETLYSFVTIAFE